MRIGYARVCTRAQGDSLDTQREDLTRAGCDRVYEDTTSGVKSDRPGLRLALEHAVREGDVLVVTRLDRLGRSTVDTLTTVNDLASRGIRIKAPDWTRSPPHRPVSSCSRSWQRWPNGNTSC